MPEISGNYYNVKGTVENSSSIFDHFGNVILNPGASALEKNVIYTP